MKQYYLYEHRTLDGLLFYVGKGTYREGNSYGGYQRAHSTNNRSPKWKEIASKGFTVNIIYESDDLDDTLLKEDELWMDCPYCVNKQLTNRFKDYKLFKIKDDLYTMYIFGKVYLVYNDGSIFNQFGKSLKFSDNGKGYKLVTFSNGETIKKNFYVHRIIAECFVANPDGLKIVNHINLNRSDNSFTNLEWCTQAYNINHSVNLLSYIFEERIKSIYQFTLSGEFIKEWDRASTVANLYNCTEEAISQVCSQNTIKCCTSNGYIWIYKEDYENNNRVKFNKTLKKFLDKSRE